MFGVIIINREYLFLIKRSDFFVNVKIKGIFRWGINSYFVFLTCVFLDDCFAIDSLSLSVGMDLGIIFFDSVFNLFN